LLVLAFFVALAAKAGGQEPALEPAAIDRPIGATGNSSCLAVACHGGQATVRGKSESQLLTARAGRIWLQQDPHARAAETISGARYQEILNRLAGTDAHQADRRILVAAQCAECHDPQSLHPAAENAQERRAARGHVGDRDRSDPISDQPQGIGCESCHGNAERWLGRHYERDVSARELVQLGLRDLKHPFVRATVCASCHVGDARHDLNHDMLAAGHPPLRFEFSSDHERLPRHWRVDRNAATTSDEAIQLWTAGQLASAASALQLLAARAERARAILPVRAEAKVAQPPITPSVRPKTPWPELAEYNCLSCHQRVRAKDERNGAGSLVSRANGSVAWSAWHYRLAMPIASRMNPHGESYADRWGRIALLLARPQANDAQLLATARQATDLQNDLIAQGERLPRLGPPRATDVRDPVPGQQDTVRVTAADVLDMTRQVVEPTSDWETLCQATLGLEAVRRSLRPVNGASPVTVQKWREADRELRRIRVALAFGEREAGGKREDFDWPRIGLPELAEPATELAPRDWPALIQAFDRPLELLRALDGLQ